MREPGFPLKNRSGTRSEAYAGRGEGGYLYELPGLGLLLSNGRRRVSSLLPSLPEKACGPAVLTREPHLPSHLPRSLLGDEEPIVHATAGTRTDLAVTGFG